MQSPLTSLHNIYKKADRFRRNYCTKSFLVNGCRHLSDFVYDKSKETAFILLAFNALSILSSHISQISGLKKSKRENKDYLIAQEKKELLLDLVFNVPVPFAINHKMMKKVDGGEIITQEFMDKLENIVAPGVGVSKENLYSTEHIIPIKEQVADMGIQFLEKVKFNKKFSDKTKKKLGALQDTIRAAIPKKPHNIKNPTLEQITTDFDWKAKHNLIPKELTKELYHGSATDELLGMRNGILILSTLAYTVIASNIIIPILKNILANISYSRMIKKNHIDPAAEERKKKYQFHTPTTDVRKPAAFNEFVYNKDNTLYKASNTDTFDFKTNQIRKKRLDSVYSDLPIIPVGTSRYVI